MGTTAYELAREMRREYHAKIQDAHTQIEIMKARISEWMAFASVLETVADKEPKAE